MHSTRIFVMKLLLRKNYTAVHLSCQINQAFSIIRTMSETSIKTHSEQSNIPVLKLHQYWWHQGRFRDLYISISKCYIWTSIGDIRGGSGIYIVQYLSVKAASTGDIREGSGISITQYLSIKSAPVPMTSGKVQGSI